MTNREVTWVEAAIIALNESPTLWMTAPELIREIQRKEIRTMKSNYGQAVRTLRSALNSNSKKQYSMFLRSEGDFNVSFALRERLGSSPNPSVPPPTPTQKRKTYPHPPPHLLDKEKSRKQQQQQQQILTNGLPEQSSFFSPSSSPTKSDGTHKHTSFSSSEIIPSKVFQSHSHPLTHEAVPVIPTVEIDPSIKPLRQNSDSDISSCLCLPSPLTSILGPKKTLHLLSESTVPASLRPKRLVQIRKKQAIKENESDIPLSPLLNGYTTEGSFPSPVAPQILQMEQYHTISSYLSEVSCVRSYLGTVSSSLGSKSSCNDSCCSQGDRSHSASFEIEPKLPKAKRIKDDFEAHGSSAVSSSDSDSESESELSDFHIQTRPNSQLFVRRLSQQKHRVPKINYSLLGESTSEANEDESEKEIDVEYVNPSSCYPKPRHMTSVKRQGRPRTKRKMRLEETEFEEVKRVEQKRNVSSLFQQQSPLLSENMKSILNMEAFMGLSESQRSQLVKLLPAVDRTSPSTITSDCLNNSFFSSALREWVEQVAMGAFTAEYRAKVRADEKKRAALKAEEAWKEKFFEENWGDRTNSEEKKPADSVLYYPHSKLSGPLADCLETILKSHHGDSPPRSPPLSPLQPPLPLSTHHSFPTVTTSQTTASTTTCTPDRLVTSTSVPDTPMCLSKYLEELKHQAKPKLKSHATNIPKKGARISTATVAKSTKLASTSSQVTKRNHVAKKVAQKFSASLIGKSGKVVKFSTKKSPVKLLASAKGGPVDKLKTSKIIEQLKLNSQNAKTGSVNSKEFLTRLPPRTPYQSLLLSLNQASKQNKISPFGNSSNPPQQQYIPPSTAHAHSVFHDHFALLSEPHIPSEFSFPVTTLPVQFPIDVYNSHVCQRVVKTEHSYAKDSGVSLEADSKKSTEMTGSHQLNLKLSVPRSLIQANDKCECDKGALVFCSQCHSLYHAVCSSTSTLCSTCTTLASLNLS